MENKIDLTIEQKLVIGFILILVTSTAVYFSLGDTVRMRVDDDKTVFYVKDSRWLISGIEQNRLFNGTKIINRVIKSISNNLVKSGNKLIRTRNTTYSNGAMIVDTYVFEINSTDIEKFPVEHKVELFNAKGLFYRYSVDRLQDTGDKRKLVNEYELEFGYNMKVELENDYRWAWIGYPYGSDSLAAQYDIDSDYEVLNFRLFDPPTNQTLLIGNSTMNSTIFNIIGNTTTANELKAYLPENTHINTINNKVQIKCNNCTTESSGDTGFVSGGCSGSCVKAATNCVNANKQITFSGLDNTYTITKLTYRYSGQTTTGPYWALRSPSWGGWWNYYGTHLGSVYTSPNERSMCASGCDYTWLSNRYYCTATDCYSAINWYPAGGSYSSYTIYGCWVQLDWEKTVNANNWVRLEGSNKTLSNSTAQNWTVSSLDELYDLLTISQEGAYELEIDFSNLKFDYDNYYFSSYSIEPASPNYFETTDIYVFNVGESEWTNLTVSYPNSTILINNQNMTFQNTTSSSYTGLNFTTGGTYSFGVVGVNSTGGAISTLNWTYTVPNPTSCNFTWGAGISSLIIYQPDYAPIKTWPYLQTDTNPLFTMCINSTIASDLYFRLDANVTTNITYWLGTDNTNTTLYELSNNTDVTVKESLSAGQCQEFWWLSNYTGNITTPPYDTDFWYDCKV